MQLAAAGLVLGLVGVALLLMIPQGGYDCVVVLFPIEGCIYLAAGVVAWARRPSNRIGALPATGGLVWTATGWVNTAVPALIAAGLIVATVPLAIIVHLLHAFPAGRLRGAVSRWTVLAGYAVCLFLQAPQRPDRRRRDPGDDRSRRDGRRATDGRQPGRRRHSCPRRGSVRVVVSEDQALMRDGLVLLLKRAGFEVVGTAADSDDLVRKARAHRPEIVLADIRMPPAQTDEGLRAALRIREAGPEIAIMVRGLVFPGALSPVLRDLRVGLGSGLVLARETSSRLRRDRGARLLVLDGDTVAPAVLAGDRGLLQDFLDRGGWSSGSIFAPRTSRV